MNSYRDFVAFLKFLSPLLWRPAILVMSVLLTASLMCVTTSSSSPPSSCLSSVLHLLCLTPLWLQLCLRHLGTVGALLMWPVSWSSLVSTVFPSFPILSGLNGLKIAPVAVGEQLYQAAPPRGDVELYESSVRTCEGQKTAHPTSILLALFLFFKTENDRFTTGLFKQTLTLNLPTPTKRYQKCTIVLIHLLKV